MLYDEGLAAQPGRLTVQLLGPVRLGARQADITLPPKVRQVLAVLALRSGSVVTHNTLITELWGENPPRSATTTMQTYIYQLRQAVNQLGDDGQEFDALRTVSPGYALKGESIEIDIDRFRALIKRARVHLHDSPELTISLTRQALQLVRGDPLMDITLGQALIGSAVRLREEIMNTRQLVIDAEIRLERYSEVIGELYELCTRYPLREWFYYDLIDVLTRTGRRAEALAIYADLSRRLRSELGVDPSQPLQKLYLQILNGDERSEITAFR